MSSKVYQSAVPEAITQTGRPHEQFCWVSPARGRGRSELPPSRHAPAEGKRRDEIAPASPAPGPKPASAGAIPRRPFGTDAVSRVIVPSPCRAHARIHNPARAPALHRGSPVCPRGTEPGSYAPRRVEAIPSRPLTVVSLGRRQELRGRTVTMPPPCESVRAPTGRARERPCAPPGESSTLASDQSRARQGRTEGRGSGQSTSRTATTSCPSSRTRRACGIPAGPRLAVLGGRSDSSR